jgi:hypothetical protein
MTPRDLVACFERCAGLSNQELVAAGEALVRHACEPRVLEEACRVLATHTLLPPPSLAAALEAVLLTNVQAFQAAVATGDGAPAAGQHVTAIGAVLALVAVEPRWCYAWHPDTFVTVLRLCPVPVDTATLLFGGLVTPDPAAPPQTLLQEARRAWRACCGRLRAMTAGALHAMRAWTSKEDVYPLDALLLAAGTLAAFVEDVRLSGPSGAALHHFLVAEVLSGVMLGESWEDLDLAAAYLQPVFRLAAKHISRQASTACLEFLSHVVHGSMVAVLARTPQLLDAIGHGACAVLERAPTWSVDAPGGKTLQRFRPQEVAARQFALNLLTALCGPVHVVYVHEDVEVRASYTCHTAYMYFRALVEARKSGAVFDPAVLQELQTLRGHLQALFNEGLRPRAERRRRRAERQAAQSAAVEDHLLGAGHCSPLFPFPTPDSSGGMRVGLPHPSFDAGPAEGAMLE